jgi:hypothetical protein
VSDRSQITLLCNRLKIWSTVMSKNANGAANFLHPEKKIGFFRLFLYFSTTVTWEILLPNPEPAVGISWKFNSFSYFNVRIKTLLS